MVDWSRERLDSILGDRLMVGLREYAELEGITFQAAQMRAYRGTLGVPTTQRGPRSPIQILTDNLRARYLQPIQ